MVSTKILPWLLLAGTVKAQSFSFSDLFGQASKQKNYYLQQIAAYQALESELKQGYGVIKNGLGGIASINTAELNAHTAFYQSLQTPSVAIKNSSQVKDILHYQNSITTAFSQPMGEISYFNAVKTKVLADCAQDLSDLQNLLAANKLQLSDDERLKRLNAIHASMLDKYRFSQSFINALKVLALQRQRESNDAQTLNQLYENH